MRTTVTLDDDVAARLERIQRERGRSFKEVVNTTLRAGLERGGAAPEPYRLPTYDMRLRPGVDLTHALRLAADLEDEEIVRKLELRK